MKPSWCSNEHGTPGAQQEKAMTVWPPVNDLLDFATGAPRARHNDVRLRCLSSPIIGSTCHKRSTLPICPIIAVSLAVVYHWIRLKAVDSHNVE